MRPGSAPITHAGTTWAPVGQTPVVKVTGARFRVNMISAVTARGALRFAVFDGTTTAGSFTESCKRLVHDTPGPVYLTVDGHPAHRSRTVKDYAASTAGTLTLFYLHGYSPELNPDEWVWKNVRDPAKLFMRSEAVLASAVGLGRGGGWRRRYWCGRPGAAG